VPWHQDSAYCHPDSWSTLQVSEAYKGHINARQGGGVDAERTASVEPVAATLRESMQAAGVSMLQLRHCVPRSGVGELLAALCEAVSFIHSLIHS